MQPIRRVSTIVLNAFRFHWEQLSREGDYCPASPAFLAACSALAHADNLLKKVLAHADNLLKKVLHLRGDARKEVEGLGFRV